MQDGVKKNVIAPTQVRLTMISGTGRVIPTSQTVTLNTGVNTAVFNNIICETQGVKRFRIETISGMVLTSQEFDIEVYEQPHYLDFIDLYRKGHAGSKLPRFTMRAINVNNDLNTNFYGNVTIEVVNATTGQILGTTTKQAVAGYVTFDNVYFDQAGVYQIRVNSEQVVYSHIETIVINPAIAFTEIKVPKFIIGFPGGDSFNWRVPAYALVKLANLHPNTEYRFKTRAINSTSTAAPETGVGACLYFDEVNDSAYYSSKFGNGVLDTMAAPLPYSSFVTDGSGEKNLWINIVPNTYNGVFTNNVSINWVLNVGTERGNVITRYRTANASKTLHFGSSVDNKATGIADRNSGIDEKHFVLLYTGSGANEQLMSIAQVQDDGTDLGDYNRNITPWKPFDPSGPEYYKALHHTPHSWATIIPNGFIDGTGNQVSAGITKMEEYDENGILVKTWTDADGVWAGVSTNFPDGGMVTPITNFETPYMSELLLINANGTNICNNEDLLLMVITHGTKEVNFEYSEDGGLTWQIIEANIPVSNISVGSYVQYVWDFQNFKSFGVPVKLRFVSTEHNYIFAETKTLHIYNQPEIIRVTYLCNRCSRL